MTPEEAGSVTQMIGGLKDGADDAVAKLWERYSHRIIGLARVRLRSMPRLVADQEDVALSAFDSFCARTARGEFPKLEDREDLWRLVARITARKAIKLVQHEHRLKRGGGLTFGQSAQEGSDEGDSTDPLAQIPSNEPTTEFAAMMAEEWQGLLGRLNDETLRKVALWKGYGDTKEEIAARLDCAPRTVDRKLKLIREMWEGELP